MEITKNINRVELDKYIQEIKVYGYTKIQGYLSKKVAIELKSIVEKEFAQI